MATAFVLSGGGSLGAVQVSMLQALEERGVRPDLLVGASAGALNAAFVADHGFTRDSLTDLADVWLGLRRADVFPFAPRHHLLALVGARSSLCLPTGLRRLLATHLRIDRLEDAAIPLHVVATDVLSGIEVLLSQGDAMAAVAASSAIPAVLPAVELDGRVLFDGGVADNTPISQAVALGADRIVVIPAGVSCALESPPRSALATAVHALTLLIEQRLVHDVAAHRDQVEIIVAPPLCPLAVSSMDFRHARSLIGRARTATAAWFDAGFHRLPHPERFLSLHVHGRSSPDAADRHGGHAAQSPAASSMSPRIGSDLQGREYPTYLVGFQPGAAVL
jgi:NTE family protein